MARWYRSHANKLNKPKVIRLSDKLYRTWDGLLCIACEFDGVLPSLADMALLLRKSEEATQEQLDELIRREFFAKTARGIEPHKWNEWQYKSDSSTERVQQFRKRRGNVSETPSESETEADTERTTATAVGSAGNAETKINGVQLATVRGRRGADGRNRGAPLPLDWQPDDACQAYAAKLGLDPAVVAKAFVLHWTEGNGRNKKRPGWIRTWEVWCDRDAARPVNGRSITHPRKEGEIASLIRGGMSLKDQPVEGF